MSEDSWFTSRLWQACLFSLAPYDIASAADLVLKPEQAIINKNDCSCLRLNSKEQEWMNRPINYVCHNCNRVANWAWSKYIVRQKTKGLIYVCNRYILPIKGLRDLSGDKSHYYGYTFRSGLIIKLTAVAVSSKSAPSSWAPISLHIIFCSGK